MASTFERLPNFGIDGLSGITGMVAWGLIGLLLLIIAGVLAFWLLNNKKYNIKIVILEDVAGSDDLEIIGRDKATLVKMGDSGMEILYLQKRKKYLGAYGKRMGKNTYNFVIGPDGYWYNVTLGSLTEGLDKIKINPTNVNMRYQSEGLAQTIKSRYNEATFWQKYAGLIAYILLILVVGIMVFLMFDKFLETANISRETAITNLEIAEEMKRIIGALDSLKASGGLENVG